MSRSVSCLASTGSRLVCSLLEPWNSIRRILLTFHRLRDAALAAMCAATLAWSSTAHASAQVNKFSLAFSMNPTSVKPKQFNELVDTRLNRAILLPRGYEPLKQISFAWLFDAHARYFVRPDFAI